MQEDGTSATKAGDKGDQPVTISAPPAAAITIDPQNPLPEPSFLHRRIIAYLVVMVSLALMWYMAISFRALEAPEELLTLSKWIIGFAALISTYYYIAPSAAELTNMIQSAKIIRSGMNLAGNAAGDANRATETRLDRAERGAERRFEQSMAPDSQIPQAPLTDAPPPPSGEDGEDAAPRGRG
jgi:hypothetical protein